MAVVLAYAMMPGALELTENAIHLVTHGDTAHADEDHAPDESGDEHGCSGTYHACTCHSSPQFVNSALAPALVVQADSRANMGSHAILSDCGFVRGIDRPPQA